jgi:hypothetical protein
MPIHPADQRRPTPRQSRPHRCNSLPSQPLPSKLAAFRQKSQPAALRHTRTRRMPPQMGSFCHPQPSQHQPLTVEDGFVSPIGLFTCGNRCSIAFAAAPGLPTPRQFAPHIRNPLPPQPLPLKLASFRKNRRPSSSGNSLAAPHTRHKARPEGPPLPPASNPGPSSHATY